MRHFLFSAFVGVAALASAESWARHSSTTYGDIRSLLGSGQESAAELTSYYFLRNYPNSTEAIEVRFVLAEIYERQTRFDEMVLWLKDLEKDPRLQLALQPRLAYLMYNAQVKRGDQSAAEIQKSLLLRKFPQSEWTKKVVVR